MFLLDAVIIGLAAAFLPGPDFVLLIKNSLQYGRKHGIYTALGVSTAVIIHISVSISGFSLVIEKVPFLLDVIRAAGSSYLIYLGYKAVKSTSAAGYKINTLAASKDLHAKTSFNKGFICNFFNPNSILFFLSVFSQLVEGDVPMLINWLYGAVILTLVAGFYMLFAIGISQRTCRMVYIKYSRTIERSLGLLLIVFALTIAYSIFE
ncbi:LysE family translocator [Alkalicoccus halolimnae]|uniref:LysE family transporter n=1 Tax=Alkalicoccus halolimnae TaxID=1667239 RepID=A0A5C7FFQ1_9BACI|nr:LysE family transporter [Alkalicoccus halolimnae]TXF81561.1 LysE family translocator [Alkalicoccus halolimnae]